MHPLVDCTDRDEGVSNNDGTVRPPGHTERKGAGELGRNPLLRGDPSPISITLQPVTRLHPPMGALGSPGHRGSKLMGSWVGRTQGEGQRPNTTAGQAGTLKGS